MESFFPLYELVLCLTELMFNLQHRNGDANKPVLDAMCLSENLDSLVEVKSRKVVALF